MEYISVGTAVNRGILVVNCPVWLLLALPAACFLLHAPPIVSVASLPFGFIAAWLWWSISAPKWRLWAYQRVSSTGELKAAAVRAQLIWPDGSIFSKTEIKSEQHRNAEREFERQRP